MCCQGEFCWPWRQPAAGFKGHNLITSATQDAYRPYYDQPWRWLLLLLLFHLRQSKSPFTTEIMHIIHIWLVWKWEETRSKSLLFLWPLLHNRHCWLGVCVKGTASMVGLHSLDVSDSRTLSKISHRRGTVGPVYKRCMCFLYLAGRQLPIQTLWGSYGKRDCLQPLAGGALLPYRLQVSPHGDHSKQN